MTSDCHGKEIGRDLWCASQVVWFVACMRRGMQSLHLLCTSLVTAAHESWHIASMVFLSSYPVCSSVVVSRRPDSDGSWFTAKSSEPRLRSRTITKDMSFLTCNFHGVNATL